MKRLFTFSLLTVLLAVTAVGTSHRALLSRYGRLAGNLQPENSNAFVRPLSVQDISKNGPLTVVTGAEVYDAFQLNLPLTPHIVTQKNLLDVNARSTYLITTNRELFRTMKKHVPEVDVFRSGGRVYNGVRFPNAFILETPLSKKTVLDISVALPDLTETSPSERYVFFKETDEIKRLLEDASGTITANVILPSQKYLKNHRPSEALLESKGDVYVMGENVRHAKESMNIYDYDLILVDEQYPIDWYRGLLSPPGRFLYGGVPPILVVIVGLLGTILQERTFRWVLFIVTGFVLYFLPWFESVTLVGLTAAALIQIGFNEGRSVTPWLLVSGLLVYAFAFSPHAVYFFPFNQQFFWGIVGGLVLVSSRLLEQFGQTVAFGDLIAFVLGGLALLFAFLFTFGSQTLLSASLYLTTLPLLSTIVSEDRLSLRWSLVGGVLAWFVIFTSTMQFSVIFFFIGSMACWSLMEFWNVWVLSKYWNRRG